MATFTWTNAAGGDWSVATNWVLSPGGGVGTPPPGNGDTADFNDLTSSYTVTVDADTTVGSGVNAPFISIDASPSGVLLGTPTFSISGTLTASISYVTDVGDPATSMTIEAGGSLDIPVLLFSLNIPETITISATAGTAGGCLELGGPSVGGPTSSKGSTVTLDFANSSLTAPNTGVIQIDGASSPDTVTSQIITDVAWGDKFVITGANFTGDTVALNTDTDVLTVTGPGDSTPFTMDSVSLAPGATNDFVASGDVIEAVCYARGTMIRTPVGELPVEKLRPGKQVITLVDGQEVPQTVIWLGHRRIGLGGHPRPETVAPIRIRRDATRSPTGCRTAI